MCAQIAHERTNAPDFGLGPTEFNAIVEAHLRALERGAQDARAGRNTRAVAQRAAVYSALTQTLTDVGGAVLSEAEFTTHVHNVLLNVDTDPIGGLAARKLAELLHSTVRTYPAFWIRLEGAWPDLSVSNQRAVAECGVQGPVPGGRAKVLKLVNRGCHDSVKTYVYRILGH